MIYNHIKGTSTHRDVFRLCCRYLHQLRDSRQRARGAPGRSVFLAWRWCCEG